MTHTIPLGSIRSFQRRATDPRGQAWPLGTVVTASDVVVVGQSLVGAAGSVGTPLVRVGESCSPTGEGGYCCVVVTRVEAVMPREDGVGEEVWLDAELDGCEAVPASARLIGRRPTRIRRHYAVRPSRRPGALVLALPGDVHEGDLVALACRVPVALHDIRRRTRHWERLDG